MGVDPEYYRSYIKPAKRAATLRDRKIDFESAAEVFDGVVIDIPDERFDYGEMRVVTVGHLHERMVIVVWTERGDARHVIDEESQ